MWRNADTALLDTSYADAVYNATPTTERIRIGVEQPYSVVRAQSNSPAGLLRFWLAMTWSKDGSLGTRRWRKLRESVLRRDAGLCQPCQKHGRVTVATEVDHIVNRKAGGTDEGDNLQSICSPCHEAKTIAEAKGKQWDGKQRQRIGPDGWPV